MSKIKNINKKHVIVLIFGYFVIVGILASQLNKIFCPIWGDVLLFNEVAKSLADSGTIRFANMDGVTVKYYLYPFILSFVYKFFYNPYTITYSTRLLGILLMTSTIFPSYLLLKKMKYEGKKLLLLSFASIIIPDMMQSWLTVTEVLAYPLFMWTIYLFYIDIEAKEHCKTTLLMAVLCYLDYMTRSQNLVIPLAYIGSLIWFILIDIKNKNKLEIIGYLKKVVLFTGIFGILYGLVPKILTILHVISNVDASNASYASSSLNKLISDPAYYIALWGVGCVLYIFYIVLAFGFLTIVLPFFYRNYGEKDRKLVVFINILLFLTIGIVVLLIFSKEESLSLDTHRIHMRYFMYFYAPYLFLLYKIDFNKFQWNKTYSLILIAFIAFICFGRYIYSIRENSFLGAEGMALTIYRIAKEQLTKYPALEILSILFTLFVILLLAYILKVKSWKWFMKYVFPFAMIIITMTNIFLHVDRNRYITKVGQGDYIGRYAPVSDYIRKYNTGEVVVVVKALRDDNEMQTLQCITGTSADIISLGELESLCLNSNGVVKINEFDRTGYFYVPENIHRILEDAKCMVFFKPYLNGIEIDNEIEYEDDSFVVYNLDNGALYMTSQAVNEAE